MPKRITRSTIIGEQGVALIAKRVLEMGFVWHQRQVDAGIDGSIEIRDPETGQVMNRHVLVQSKATAGPFTNEDNEGFEYVCSEDDLEYWLSGNAPVLLVCSRPSQDTAWFVSVKDHFSDPSRRANRRARFHKQRDVFDSSAAQRIADLTASVGPSVYLGPPRHRETLTTNLLTPAGLPPVINAAPAAILDRSEGRSRMVKEGIYRADWTIRSKVIYSFQSLDQEPLSLLVDGDAQTISTAEWTETSDRDVEKALVHLLNNTLQEQLHSDLDWHGDRGYFFFRATEDLTPKKIYSASRIGRTVFRGYYPRKDDPSKFAFYRHAALRRQWHRLDEGWVLEINPTYHFTFDGRRESKYASEYLSEIKRKEGHGAVRSDLFAWAKYLRSSAGRLEGSPTIVFGRLIDLTVHAGLYDELWRKPKEEDLPESLEHDPRRLF